MIKSVPTLFAMTLSIGFSMGLASSLSADVVIRAVEAEEDVIFFYDGFLDLTGLASTTGNETTDSHQLGTANGGSFINAFATPDGGTFFSDPFATAPEVNWVTSISGSGQADVFGGDHFVVFSAFGDPESQFPDPLRLHTSDIVDGFWEGAGFMQFNGTSLSELGVDLSSDRIWTLNNAAADRIILTAIPEPSLFAVLGLLTAATVVGRRTRGSHRRKLLVD